MKRHVAAALASITALGLLAACGDSKSSSSSLPTTVSGSLVPSEVTTPPGETISSSGATLPESMIDLMISQLEANGLKVDKACITALLQDDSMRKLVAASSGGTPSPEVIQKFISCMKP